MEKNHISTLIYLRRVFHLENGSYLTRIKKGFKLTYKINQTASLNLGKMYREVTFVYKVPIHYEDFKAFILMETQSFTTESKVAQESHFIKNRCKCTKGKKSTKNSQWRAHKKVRKDKAKNSLKSDPEKKYKKKVVNKKYRRKEGALINKIMKGEYSKASEIPLI